MKQPQQIKRVFGITLIELMIAIGVSLILMLGVGTVFINSKRTYVVQEDFARLQENARVAMKHLQTDIRLAGFVGCAFNPLAETENELDALTNTENNDFLSNFRVGLEGFEATNTGPNTDVTLASATATWAGSDGGNVPSEISGANPAPMPGSDILIIRHANDSGLRLSQNKEAANLRIHSLGYTVNGSNCVPELENLCQGDILLVSDCKKARIFQATGVQNDGAGQIKIVHSNASGYTPGNRISSWGGSSTDPDERFEAEDSQLLKYKAFAYYVAFVPNTSTPALYRKSAVPGSAPEQLVRDVENMQVLYGLDLEKNGTASLGDGVANRYVTANNISASRDNVVSARVSLLMRTPDELPNRPVNAGAYLVASSVSTMATRVTPPSDRRLRKVITTTVKLRNKGRP